MKKSDAKTVLKRFLSFPLTSSEGILATFAALPGAISHFDGGKNNFVYIPGSREDRVLLVAHADTVWDSYYGEGEYNGSFTERFGVYRSANPACGIGADDRAGCAILWLLKDCGHSLLIVDGEEHGQIGSHHIADAYPVLFDELNRHSYMLQFDRRNRDDYKVYSLPVGRDFTDFIERVTGYHDAGRSSRTDIVVLCRDICGANLSIGYYDEHTAEESLVFRDWFQTLTLAEAFLAKPQTRYPLLH
ncbi:MAG: hypothetical protein IJW46_05135 [Clostridia bacterium]|nr:hypothetical protein [Clostridia bacterium]